MDIHTKIKFYGMKWLSSLIGEFLYSIGLDTSGKIGGSVQFFIYDVIKIVFLLCMLIFIISYIQSFFPQERTKWILGTFHGIGANILAALLGTVTPFVLVLPFLFLLDLQVPDYH